MGVIKIYTSDNILGRVIQSYIHSISDSVFTSDIQTFIETEPALSSDIIFVNLISSQLSPLKTIQFINTKLPGDDNMIIVIIVDSCDISMCENMILNQSVVILDLSAPLSYYSDIIKNNSSISENIKQNSKLTSKQRTVLCCLLDGFSIQEISKKLQCNSKTIYTHRKNILKKINFKNTAELNKSIARLRGSDV